jgi:choline dehydrogenase-like flavoprotein
VNAKASPLVTHIPDAIEHGVEVRDLSMVTEVEVDDSSGRVTGVRYIHDDRERFQRAEAVAVAGYSIETPRLLLNSTSRTFPHGLANGNDQVGRCVMVQGATQVAGRFREEMRMYKAPPPEISSEQFYETDPARGFARGFSIQTVGPLPIEWAQHVLADGHWGQALREYMRDYNHWYTLGVLCELLPLAENRVTLAPDVTDQSGMPVARMDYSQCENDPKNGGAEPVHRRRQRDADAGLGEPGADDHGARLAARRAPGSEAPRRASVDAAAPMATSRSATWRPC